MKSFKKLGKRFLAVALVAMSLFAVAMPAITATAETGLSIGATAYVTLASGTLNIRSDPSTTSAILGTVGHGTKVTILGSGTGTSVNGSTLWYRVQIIEKKNGGTAAAYLQGWAHHSYIVKTDPLSGSSSAPGTEVRPLEVRNESVRDMEYHYTHVDVYKAFATNYFKSLGRGLGDYECSEYNNDTKTTCSAHNKNYFLKLRFWGGTTKACTTPSCTITMDTVMFQRHCSVCGVNNQYYDLIFSQDVHSNSNCRYQTGPYL